MFRGSGFLYNGAGNVHKSVHFVMFETVSITEARKNLLPMVKSLSSRPDGFIVTKQGRPLAVLLSYEEYLRMEETVRVLQNYRLKQQLLGGLSEPQIADDEETGELGEHE